LFRAFALPFLADLLVARNRRPTMVMTMPRAIHQGFSEPSLLASAPDTANQRAEATPRPLVM